MPNTLEQNPILIYHQRSHHSTPQMVGHCPIWRTCLRQIIFFQKADLFPGSPLLNFWGVNEWDLEASDGNFPLGGQIYRNSEAIDFLMRVLCGLESPVIGETEVMGQFRQFLGQQLNSTHPLLNPQSHWQQKLFSGIKMFREEHVRHLGSQSYGSLVRKELRSFSKVALIGSGVFIADLLPWLKDKSQIDLWCRRTEKGDSFKQMHPGLRVFPLHDRSPSEGNEALIIAAPIPDKELMTLLKKKWKLIIDLRGEQHLMVPGSLNDFIENQKCYISLTLLTSQLQNQQGERDESLQMIRQLISGHCLQLVDQPRLRPLGWEDLCA